MSQSVLVIDDVSAALRLMSDLGRKIAEEAALEVRETVLAYAAKRRWSVIPYSAFADWAHKLCRSSQMPWVVLDPLFASAQTAATNAISVRLTRVGLTGRFEYGDGWTTVPQGDVVVLDDAAASGFTLGHVSRWLEQDGRAVKQYVLCASTREARDVALRARRGASWNQLMPGDWMPIHLRDACAHLPFSGRRVGLAGVTGVGGTQVEFRVHASALVGTPWHSLTVIAEVQQAIQRSRLSIAGALSAKLGRPAVVADLALLGPAIPALIEPGVSAESHTRLADMLPRDCLL